MKLDERVKAFVELGKVMNDIVFKNIESIYPFQLREFASQFESISNNQECYNAWFIPSFVNRALIEISKSLTKENINTWLEKYNKNSLEIDKSIRVAIIMAGNIPLVGFHDLLCVLITGNSALIKLSSDDNTLLPALLNVLCCIEPRFVDKIEFTDKQINNFDTIIATGSNNTSRYFDYYFSKYPHIIRKNRNSIAVLYGNEDENELNSLASDILLYFGKGCRSVSKLFVPENYNFQKLFEAIESYAAILKNHNKYLNNYTYTKAIYLINIENFLDNSYFIIRRSNDLHAPISCINYEYYNNINSVIDFIDNNKQNLQCIVSNQLLNIDIVKIGASQSPNLWNYADNVDTIQFLIDQKS